MSRPLDDPVVRDGLLLESAIGASGAVLVRAAGRLTLRATGGRLRVVATSRAVDDVLVTVRASDLVLAAGPSTEAS